MVTARIESCGGVRVVVEEGERLVGGGDGFPSAGEGRAGKGRWDEAGGVGGGKARIVVGEEVE